MNKEFFVAAIIIARNEEKIISNTIESIENQTLKPYRIIVVNDGSTDKTAEIATKFDSVELVDRDEHESYLGRKELAETYNAGLKKLENDSNCQFILVVGADQLLPKNYLSEIINRMTQDQDIAIASGVVKGRYVAVPGGGNRVVRYDFWKKLGLRYPINYGFEGYLLWKAQSIGYKIMVYPDLKITTQRKGGTLYNSKVYYYYGLGLRALGYSVPYALGRILLFAKKNPKGARCMMSGFFSKYNELYEKELRDYIKQTQLSNLLRFKPEYLKRIIKKLVYEK